MGTRILSQLILSISLHYLNIYDLIITLIIKRSHSFFWHFITFIDLEHPTITHRIMKISLPILLSYVQDHCQQQIRVKEPQACDQYNRLLSYNISILQSCAKMYRKLLTSKWQDFILRGLQFHFIKQLKNGHSKFKDLLFWSQWRYHNQI